MFLKTINNKNNHFIIAAPRSGTTWLSKMLNAHPQINGVERRLFGNYADFVLDQGNNNPRLRVTLDKYVNSLLLHHGMDKTNNNLLKSIIEGILKEEQHISGKPITVDKITPYLNTSQNVAKAITKYFPKAKIIYLVRDGRDVLTSGVFHWFNKQSAITSLSNFEQKRREIFLNNQENTLERFFQDKEIIQWANEWKQPLETIEVMKETHDIKIITYEDLLENQEFVLASCFKFLNAKTNKNTLQHCLESGSFKTMSDGRNQGEAKATAHVRKGIAGDWQNYFTYQDGKLFNEIAGDMLLKFGYISSDAWFKELTDAI